MLITQFAPWFLSVALFSSLERERVACEVIFWDSLASLAANSASILSNKKTKPRDTTYVRASLWLRVEQRIDYRLSFPAYRCLYGQVPLSLSADRDNDPRLQNKRQRHLRSTDSTPTCVHSQFRRHVTSPLTSSTTMTTTLEAFKRGPKHFLSIVILNIDRCPMACSRERWAIGTRVYLDSPIPVLTSKKGRLVKFYAHSGMRPGQSHHPLHATVVIRTFTLCHSNQFTIILLLFYLVGVNF